MNTLFKTYLYLSKADDRSANPAIMLERKLNTLSHFEVDYAGTIWSVHRCIQALKDHLYVNGYIMRFDFFIRVVRPSSYDFSFQVLIRYETFDSFEGQINLIWENAKVIQNKFEIEPKMGWPMFDRMTEEIIYENVKGL